jgi:hypothetical protein
MMTNPAAAAQEHLCVVRWRLDKFEYTRCDVRLHWSFTPIEEKDDHGA